MAPNNKLFITTQTAECIGPQSKNTSTVIGASLRSQSTQNSFQLIQLKSKVEIQHGNLGVGKHKPVEFEMTEVLYTSTSTSTSSISAQNRMVGKVTFPASLTTTEMNQREKNFVKAYFASTKIDGVEVGDDTVVIPFSGKKPSDEFKEMVKEGLIANNQYPDIKSSLNFTWEMNRPATMNRRVQQQQQQQQQVGGNTAQMKPSLMANGMREAGGAAAGGAAASNVEQPGQQPTQLPLNS